MFVLLRVLLTVVCALALTMASTPYPWHSFTARPPEHGTGYFPRPSSESVTYYLGSDVCLMFVTQSTMDAMYPARAAETKKDGMVLRGMFDATLRPHAPIMVVVSVSDPRQFTPTKVRQMVRVCQGALNPAGMPVWDMLGASDPITWDACGVLFHELAHLGDWCDPGHPLVLLSRLWPDVVPEPASEPITNPWRVLRHYWPIFDTHPGLSSRDYRSKVGHG